MDRNPDVSCLLKYWFCFRKVSVVRKDGILLSSPTQSYSKWKCSMIKPWQAITVFPDIVTTLYLEEQSSTYLVRTFEQYLYFQLNKTGLSCEKATVQSAENKRKSASYIGYFGMGCMALVFGVIVCLDIPSLARDSRILASNLKEGCLRLCRCFKRQWFILFIFVHLKVWFSELSVWP